MRQGSKFVHNLKWLPAYLWQRMTRRPEAIGRPDLIICLADHFEPSFRPDSPEEYVDKEEQTRRLERWCREYSKRAQGWRDSDGCLFRHTYFYPAEQLDKELLERLAEHCRAGWGEIEIHLHHGIAGPDTAENTRGRLLRFRDAMAAANCLAQFDGEGLPRFAFVHGNWALANSDGGHSCGVDDEVQILAETGCYADFTLPAAPHPAQIAKINALYECSLPLTQRAPHRRGRDLEVGRAPEIFPLMIQGPLMLDFSTAKARWLIPRIENGALTTANPPTMKRLRLWRKAAITVKGRADWLFIKLHCHGMDPKDDETMLGGLMERFMKELMEGARGGSAYRVHFVTAREMVNIILAACDGREGNPGDYRDYRLRRMAKGSQQTASVAAGDQASAKK